MALRFVLATYGSLGDLHPYMALGLELQRRGHQCAIATHAYYRERVESAGLEFRRLRPDYDPSETGFGKELMDGWRGTENILRKALLPNLRDTYDDLLEATRDAYALINHSIVFAAPLVADRTNIPQMSAVLAPLAMLSDHDPSHVTPEPWLNTLFATQHGLRRWFYRYMRAKSLTWCRSIHSLRTEIERPTDIHPLLEGQHSPLLSLALFSQHFAKPQPDWSKSLRQTGFLFYDTKTELSAELAKFLDRGPAPVAFTLGTAAVLNPGKFYEESAVAAITGGFRAVLLAGSNQLQLPQNPNLFVCDYAPFGALFPRCAAVVHQGGIGTTAQTLRAGCPSLVVPFAHDQPDNAARIVRLGAGRILIRRRYNARNATAELARLLGDPAYSLAAQRLGEAIRSEDGAQNAADLIENALLASSTQARPVSA